MGRGGVYGLITKITATPGRRDSIIDILLDKIGRTPGCISYVVSEDAADPDSLYVSEIWEDEASHRFALTDAEVRSAIRRAMQLSRAFHETQILRPVGGNGMLWRTRDPSRPAPAQVGAPTSH